MIGSTTRRPWRRTIATVAGTALVAAGLGMGAAPAQAADSVVSGRVVDAQGNPADGFVTIYQQQADSSFSPYSSAYIGSGYFERTVPDGVYKFEYEAVGVQWAEFYQDKSSLAEANPVTVGGGATALAAWTVERPYVVGTVTDASGRPIHDTEVSAYDATSGVEVADDYTDEKGAFVLPVGVGPVKVYASGYGDYAGEWYTDKGSFETADAVTGTAGGTPLAMALGKGGSISGVVTSDAGVPLEQVRVSADGRSDVTDKTGAYVIEGVDAGSHLVRFSDDLGEYLSEYYKNSFASATATPVAVGPNQAVGGINESLTLGTQEPQGSVELTGLVKDDTGAPVTGAFVYAWDTPNAPGKEQSVALARSNRAGVYTFDDLDEVGTETQYKIQAIPAEVGDENGFSLFGSFLGGRTSYDRAATVTVTPGTPIGGADITLMRAGGIQGSITGATGVSLAGGVELVASDGEAGYAAGAEADNTFTSRSLFPGTYKVRFVDYSGSHVPEWWKDSTFEKATEITVKPGQLVSGLNAVLGAQIATTERPEVKGYPWVGKSVSVDKGEWNLVTGTTFSYEWLIGSTVVGTGASYTPTKAQIGDKLTVRVLAENGRLSGTATTAKTSKIGYKPKLKVKVAGGKASITVKAKPVKGKKVKGSVVVKEIVKVKDNGTIKYKKIGKTKIAKGKGTVSLAKLKKGKHKLVFFFEGKGKVGSTEVKKKVKTTR